MPYLLKYLIKLAILVVIAIFLTEIGVANYEHCKAHSFSDLSEATASHISVTT